MNDEWRPIILTPEEALGLVQRGEGPPGAEKDEIVFVTADMRLKDGLLADRDRLIFEEMRVGKVVPLDVAGLVGPVEAGEGVENGEENLRAAFQERDERVAERAEKMDWGQFKGGLDERAERLRLWVDGEVAAYVRFQRVVRRGSWRFVAGKVAEQYGTGWGEDQLFGMLLCEIAAERYGEDYMEGAWN